jgi:hypothetical protein
MALRAVSNLLDRSDELRALAPADRPRLHALLRTQRRLVLAMDGLQPDVGPEVLWVLPACLAGEVLLARSRLSATRKDVQALLTEVRQALPGPLPAAVSAGPDSRRKAVALALPGVPPQQCHFHDLREAARPIYEADRHAKKELKKRVRGVRPIERQAEQERGEPAEVGRDYCAAGRAALTDDGRPPLAASGLTLQDRWPPILASLDRGATKAGRLPRGLEKWRRGWRRGLEQTASLGPPVRASDRWVKRVAHGRENKAVRPAKQGRRALSVLVSKIRQAALKAKDAVGAEPGQWFVKVTRSYWGGLFPG